MSSFQGHTVFGHLHFTKNQAVCNWFGRPISIQPTGQIYKLLIILKFRTNHFYYIFFRNCQIIAAFPNMSKYLSHIFALKSNSNISIQIYLLQELSNVVLFAHCHCYSKELKYLNCFLKQKCGIDIITLTNPNHNSLPANLNL